MFGRWTDVVVVTASVTSGMDTPHCIEGALDGGFLAGPVLAIDEVNGLLAIEYVGMRSRDCLR